MRYVCSAAAIVVALSTFAPPAVHGALNLSITNYQTVSEQRASITHWYVTFKADLVNSGPALPAITATIASRSSNVQIVPGQGALHFGPVPANGRATSADTFTILVDRSVMFDWSQVEWSFMNPVANAGPDQTAPVTSTVVLNASASSNPAGVGTLSYSWALQSAPSGSRAALSNPNSVSPSFVIDVPGTYRCRVTVTNGSGADSAMVSVSTINSPPVASAGTNQTVAVGATVLLNGSKSSDVDGDALTYAWSFVSRPPGSSAALLNALTAAPTFVADAPGSYIVQLVVRDGKADSAPATVTISTVNTPPVANAGKNQTVTAGMFVQLDGAGSTDVDGDSLTYRWSFNLLPPGSAAVLNNATSVSPTFTADKPGVYIVQLIVNDGKVDSAASTVGITTNAVQAPTANAGPDMTVHAGTTVQLGGSATDPQSYPLTYAWSLPTRPSGSSATLSQTNISNPTFIADRTGIYAAQLVVNNGVLSSPPSMITITTTNTAPVADPGAAQSVYTGDLVNLDGSRSSDADSDPLTEYSWSLLTKPEGSTAVLSGAKSKTPSFLADAAGTYVIQLIVSDAFSSSQARTVTIVAGAKTIEITPAPLRVFAQCAPGTLSITVSPAPTSAMQVSLSAETPGIASFSSNPAIIPAGSSGVNVAVSGISPGSTRVTVAAAGYTGSNVTIAVAKPTISIALNGGAASVGLAHKIGGVITLEAPAPAGGTAVTLSSAPSPDGGVTFESGTVTVPANSTTAPFSITGAVLGAATVNAAAAGFNSGNLAAQVVMLGSISLPAGLIVGSGKSAPLNVQLTTPAPADGATVSFTSSNSGKATVTPSSVWIKPGATAPETAPQVNGAVGMVGDVNVTASAGGYYSDTQSIKVIASITFSDQAVSVGPGGVKSFTILLSAPAPTGGLQVYLMSSNESAATVAPGGALVPAGQQSVDSQVTGVAVGTADITASTNPSIPGNQYFSGTGAVLHVTVERPTISIQTDSLPAGMAGANYPSRTLAATGGTGVGLFWTIPAGNNLPKGLSLGASSGTISGTLDVDAATSTFTVQVQDSGGNKATKTFTITVYPRLTITTESLPAGTAGVSYSAPLAATGGSSTTYTWSIVSGALPDGLNLSPEGVIQGTPSGSAPTATFTVQAQDSATNTTSKQFTITVGGLLSITTGPLQPGMAGADYPRTTFESSGGTGTDRIWSITLGTLPPNLSLSTDGVLSGTLSLSAISASFTVQVRDGAGHTATKQFTISVVPALVITTESLPNGVAGSAYPDKTLTASGGSGQPYTWTVSDGTLPPNLSLSTAGVLSGTPSGPAGASPITIQVRDKDGHTATKQFVLTINPALTITTDSLPTGAAGASYSKQLEASGGTGSGQTWSLVSGSSLPQGLILSMGGAISGTLNLLAKTATFTVQVKDSGNNTATKEFTLTVNPALTITTESLPSGMVGASYPLTNLTASGGSSSVYSWSVTAGTLPAGLTLTSEGALSGTPSSATTSTLTIQVKDSSENKAAKEFTLIVYPTLTITTGPLPAGTAGMNYASQLLVATGGKGSPYTWSVSTGALPKDLELTSLGVIQGKLLETAETSTFTIQAKDSLGNIGTKEFTLTVNAALTITTPSLQGATIGAAYQATLAASGGSGTGRKWTVSAGALPTGLNLSEGGVITGTPASNARSATFTIQVQDDRGATATKEFSITVALTITTPSLPAGDAGKFYSKMLEAAGGTGIGQSWSLSAGSLPSNLNLNAAGTISGTLAESAETSTFTVRLQDSGGNVATKEFTLTVNPPLRITTDTLPAGTLGGAYTATLAASGGTGSGRNWTVAAGSLPDNLSLNASDGVISGTLNSAASAPFTIRVQDSGGNIATKQFTITVETTLTITTASLPDSAVGAVYPNTQLQAAGGSGSGYTWSISAGSLPTGVSLIGDALSGTVTSAAATFTFTVRVQDNASHAATKEFTIKINPALIITTASLPAATIGSPYRSTKLAASGGSGTGYAWSVSAGSLPAGLSLIGDELVGTPSGPVVDTTFTVQVRDSVGATATKQFTVTAHAALMITTGSLHNGMVGASYTAPPLTASGGAGGYTWSVSGGSLPDGLTLNGAAGEFTGTLSSSAVTSNFTIQVQDSDGNRATKDFTILVRPTLRITTEALPPGVAGTAYKTTTLTATGGTGTGYAWSVSSGTLPHDLTLTTTGGVLSGPLAADAVSASVTIQVRDSEGNTATQAFGITINPPLSVTTLTLPDGVVGSAYSAPGLTAAGGTGGYIWSISGGTLPRNLALSPEGQFSGTLAADAVTSTFTVQVKDSQDHTATKQFTITVVTGLGIFTEVLPGGVAGAAYGPHELKATGGTGTYTWSLSVGSLPVNLNLSSGGTISGTLDVAAVTSTFTIQVEDSDHHTATRQFTLTVAPAVVITTPSLPAGTIGSAYPPSTRLEASGGTGGGYTWSVTLGSLPAGLGLNPADGTISGTVLASAVTSAFTVQVKDGQNHTATKQFTITIRPAVQVTTDSLPPGTAGSVYPNTPFAASGGAGPNYTWSVANGSLPTGLDLSPGGVLSGTPEVTALTSTFTVEARDSEGNTGRKQFTLTIALKVTTDVLPGGTAGTAYTGATLKASGGTGGYTWSLAGGSALPLNLSLGADGAISGSLSPSATTANFTVQVRDSSGGTATKQLTITVGAALTIDTPSLPTGTAGSPYSATLTASGGTGGGYTWSVTVGVLPDGLNLAPESGALTGTLQNLAVTRTFTIQVRDSALHTATKQFTLTVNAALTIITESLPSGTMGLPYSATLEASGGSAASYTWSVTAGSLPDNLNLSGAVISGTLSASAASATFTVQVRDSLGNTASKPFTLTVYPPLTITTPPLPPGMVGATYPNTSLTATGGTGSGYIWSVSAGSLPQNLNVIGSEIRGTPTAATTATFTLRVQDNGGHIATKEFTLTVNPALGITTGSLPIGTVGIAYPNTPLTAGGGTGSGYTWSVTAGVLPDGLNLIGDAISGTPSATAVSKTFTVQVRDSAGYTATKELTLTVNPALSITSTTLPTGVAGSAYPNTQLTANGGTGTGRTWSLAAGSSLPPNLNLSGDGVISGSLLASATTKTFTVRVQDSGGSTATKELTLTVNPALSITTTTLPIGVAGSAYSADLAATGGTGSNYTWSVTAGPLPLGLNLTGKTISGTLSLVATSKTFTVQVQDDGGHIATKELTLTVNPALTVTTDTLPTGTAGAAYSADLTATGGTGSNYTWSVIAGSLPTGLNLSGKTISGTLSALATSKTFTVQVQDDGAHTATKQLTLTVNPALTITTDTLPTGIAGSAYSADLAAAGGTGSDYTWSVIAGSLPEGLNLSGKTISGPLSTSATTKTFTVRVQDSGGNTATKELTLTVNPVLTVTTESLPDGVVSASYSASLAAAGGAGAPYTWSRTAGTLPAGLLLGSNGAISGTPSSAGTATFTVQVKDSLNNTATRELTLTVYPAVTITTGSLTAGVAGADYSATFAASGGVPGAYTWSVTGGAPPANLNLSADGVLSGTISASAVTTIFTVQVKDSANHAATKVFTLTVNPALVIMPATLPLGMVGAAYPATDLSATGGTGSGYTWAVSGGSLPHGLSLSVGGKITGTPEADAVTSSFTVQVQDGGGHTATREFTITVYPTLTVATDSLPGGTAGAAYSSSLAASGGTGSGQTWSRTAGSLPAGLTLGSNGAITGTLSYLAVTSTFTVQVKDSANFTATKPFTITVAPAPLAITTDATLPPADAGAPYSTQIGAIGGTLPYTWSASGLPAWLTLDTSGGFCGSPGMICGTPLVNGLYSFTITVTDNSSPTHQSVSRVFNVTVSGTGGLGTITVPNVSVGANLQVPITITLSQPTSTPVQLTISSGNAAAVRLGNASEAGLSPLIISFPTGSSSVQVFVKALAASGEVDITASADTGYTSGTGKVTITKSGFVLSGPNGIGSDFTSYQGVTTGLTVYPYRLSDSNVIVENQSIRGGLNVNVPIAVAPGTMGSLGSPTVAFLGGDASATAVFTASYVNTGNASISVSPPLGSTFSTPSNGATLNVTIQTSGFLPPSGVTVGRNLQTAISIGLNGPAGSDTVVTVDSSDQSMLKFATTPTGAGSKTIQLTIRRGFSATPEFYVRGYGSSGSVPYTISATTYGTVSTSMPLGPSGFVISTPAGQGTDFNVTLGGPDPTLGISSALFDSGGHVVALQSVAADTTITAALTSFTPGVGTVSPPSVQILGGTSTTTATFHAVSLGSTNITATATGYTSASVKATVTSVQLFLNPVGSVGRFLAASGLVNLNTPAVGDVPITITVNPDGLGLLKLAVNKTDAGSNSISVTVRSGNTNAVFWVFGTASSGTGSYTASSSGSSATDTVTLAPSAVVMYMGLPGNPSCFGTGAFACQTFLAGGPQTVYALTYQLTTDGTDAINGSQPLAGGGSITIPLTNSTPGTGSVPGSVSITGGNSFASFTFTPSALGSTVITAGNPAGWTKPAYAFGFDLTQLGITVK